MNPISFKFRNRSFVFEDIGSEFHQDIINKYSSQKVSLYNVDILLINKKYIINWYSSIRQSIYNKEGIWWIKENYEYDWCFYIDCDEYITLENNNETLEQVLLKYFF